MSQSTPPLGPSRRRHTPHAVAPPSRPSLARTAVQIVASLVLGVVLLGMTAWGALAIYYFNLPSAALRTGLSLTFAGSAVLGLLVVRPHRRAVWGFLVVFTGVVLWWLSLPPSQDRDWQPDVAVLPSATFTGNQVTIHNIRNTDYRSETDYTVRYYDKTFDLAKLRSVDLFLSYWGSPYIAHTIMSFGFEGGDHVAFSIETRFVNGYLDELAYENGAVDASLPFAEFKARSRINERAKAADRAVDFSTRIRTHLTGE